MKGANEKDTVDKLKEVQMCWSVMRSAELFPDKIYLNFFPFIFIWSFNVSFNRVFVVV